jgi:prepilin-type N-terminal cleavage/methylation domain-containing protein
VRRIKGFTLIELMVVIFMIAAVSGFAVPGIMKWRSAAKLRGAAENLKGDLELAKLRAIQENGPVAINFSEKSYQIFIDSGTTLGILDANELVLKKTSLPEGVRFDSTLTTFDAVDGDWPWPKKTRFKGRGTADAGSAMLVNSNGKKKKIKISSFGNITIEKEDAS